MFIMMAGLTMVSSEKAFAGIGVFGNGNFETGDFSNWGTDGNVFIDSTAFTTNNVIAGTSSAGLVNDVYPYCSYLVSGFAYPQFVPKSVNVSFKVRYKTDESIGGIPWDPAHAVVWTEGGAVNVFTINASGETPGPGFSVKRLDTNLYLPAAPTIPPFGPGLFFTNETPTLLVSGKIPVSTCDGVYIIFDICQYLDLEVYSGLWVDDVQFSFVNGLFGAQTFPGGGSPMPCQPPDGAGLVPGGR